MFTAATPYSRSLDNGLVLKSLIDRQDADRLAAYNGRAFGQGVGAMTAALIQHHPEARSEYWLYIEDPAAGKIVSSLCLIPWAWRCEEITLKVGEMGIVSTDEAYRNRGLVRVLTDRHQHTLREDGFDLGAIQGIPYFYRQFGYEYALPLEAHWNMQLHDIPEAWQAETSTYQLRPATPADIPQLMALYDDANRQLHISALRSPDHWAYLLDHSLKTDMKAETWLVETPAGHTAGYLRLMEHGFGSGLIVSEGSRLSIPAAKAVFHWLKTVALQRGKPYLRLNLPSTHDLVGLGRGFGLQNNGCYAWQIHLVDVARLLMKLKPVLERRLAASPYAGLTQTVLLNLYREAFELVFEAGTLRDVHAVGFREHGDIRIPPLLFAQLVLGYRSLETLKSIFPDVAVWGESQRLVDVLFPKLEGFIFTIY